MRARRHELGLSVRDLAAQTGISRSVISRLEQGKGEQVFGPPDWERLSEALRVGPLELLWFAGLLGSNALDIGKMIRSDPRQWKTVLPRLENIRTLRRLGFPGEPADPRYARARELMLRMWKASKTDPKRWKTFEEILESLVRKLTASTAQE